MRLPLATVKSNLNQTNMQDYGGMAVDLVCDKQVYVFINSLPGSANFPCNQNDVSVCFHLYALLTYSLDKSRVY